MLQNDRFRPANNERLPRRSRRSGILAGCCLLALVAAFPGHNGVGKLVEGDQRDDAQVIDQPVDQGTLIHGPKIADTRERQNKKPKSVFEPGWNWARRRDEID